MYVQLYNVHNEYYFRVDRPLAARVAVYRLSEKTRIKVFSVSWMAQCERRWVKRWWRRERWRWGGGRGGWI